MGEPLSGAEDKIVHSVRPIVVVLLLLLVMWTIFVNLLQDSIENDKKVS